MIIIYVLYLAVVFWGIGKVVVHMVDDVQKNRNYHGSW